MRILIADDNQLVRRGVAALLSSRGDCAVCGEAANGSEAVRKSIELRPDLILLDINMPAADGWETARQMRQSAPAAKIIVMSQNDAALLAPAALEAGADSCIDKSRLAHDLLPHIDALAFPLARE